MAEMPKSIRIGYRDYAVEHWPTNIATASNRLGECDRMNFVIRVREDMNPQLTAEVLLHEVIHAVWEMGCMGDPPSGDEERCVNILGNQLTQVWRDNPKFIAFMTESLSAG
jgi:hypothetical protein